MIEMHKKQLEWFKSKLGISDYTVAWIAFLKGLIPVSYTHLTLPTTPYV